MFELPDSVTGTCTRCGAVDQFTISESCAKPPLFEIDIGCNGWIISDRFDLLCDKCAEFADAEE